MQYQKELDLLDKHVKAIYEKAIKSVVDVTFKKEQDIVTSTDLYVEKHLIEKIKSSFPTDLFHSEEFHNQTELKNRTWIIDPIDGTSNYASNLPLYVVQIALYDKGDLALAYVFAPKLDKTYYAIKDQGAYLNGKRYFANDISHQTNFMMTMVGLSHSAKDILIYQKMFNLSVQNKYKLRMLGTMGLELSLTSEGVFDIFYSNVTNLWDLAPGVLLAKEAGALLINQLGKSYQLQDEKLFVCKNEKAKQIVIKEILAL